MITVSDLRFSYDRQPVLKGVSFQVQKNSLTALLGCNGAGKTTLMRCMLGLLRGYEGTITLNGRNLRDLTPGEVAARIAYIPQSNYPSFRYSVLDMVLMGTTRQVGLLSSPGKKQVALSLNALEKLGIRHLAERSYSRLSGGERQMVLIARALAQQSRILLMDEPCASLDFGNQSRVMEAMRALTRDGYTVVLSTHNPQHVLTYCHRVLALKDGQLAADGAPEECMTESLIETLYGIPVTLLDTSAGKVVLPAEKRV